MDEKKIVLLIDAENTSAKFADGIMKYISDKGDIISAQIYGDFIDNQNTKKWNNKAIEYNLQRYQADTTKAGKNAADIALVIDAMDFLYKENPADIFCIVTSDGDFTSLVERIRKEGITVIGMGKEDASPRLRRACSVYVELESIISDNKQEMSASGQSGKTDKQDKQERKNKKNKKKNADRKPSEELKNRQDDKEAEILNKSDEDNITASGKSGKTGKNTKKTKGSKDDNAQQINRNDKVLKQDNKKNNKNKDGAKKADKLEEKKDKAGKEPLKNIKITLNQLVQADESSGKQADLGGIKSRLQLKYPGFDERNYGYKSIRELIDNETKFSVIQEGNQAYVISDKRGQGDNILEQVCGFILDCCPNKVIGKHEVGGLGRKLKGKFPEFDCRAYGYGKLSMFLEDIGINLY